jgi:hypothetical protein
MNGGCCGIDVAVFGHTTCDLRPPVPLSSAAPLTAGPVAPDWSRVAAANRYRSRLSTAAGTPETPEMDEVHAMNSGEPAEVYTTPTTYDVSVIPAGIRDDLSFYGEPEHWVIRVEWRGRGTWAVTHGGSCLGADGEWDWEPRPSSREDGWLADHRFSLDGALDAAREHAPGIRVNGISALEVLAKYRKRLAERTPT